MVQPIDTAQCRRLPMTLKGKNTVCVQFWMEAEMHQNDCSAVTSFGRFRKDASPLWKVWCRLCVCLPTFQPASQAATRHACKSVRPNYSFSCQAARTSARLYTVLPHKDARWTSRKQLR